MAADGSPSPLFVAEVDPSKVAGGWRPYDEPLPPPPDPINVPVVDLHEQNAPPLAHLRWPLDKARRTNRFLELCSGDLPMNTDRKQGFRGVPLAEATLGLLSGGAASARFCGALRLPVRGPDGFVCRAPHGQRTITLARALGNGGLPGVALFEEVSLPFRGFQGGVALFDGSHFVLLPSSIQWQCVREEQSVHPLTLTTVVKREVTRVAPSDVRGMTSVPGHYAGPWSYAAWTHARALRMQLARDADARDLVALLRRYGVRVLLAPPIHCCGGDCGAARLLRSAGEDLLPGHAALAVPQHRPDVAQTLLLLLKHVAFSADLLEPALAGDLLELDPAQLPRVCDALDQHLTAYPLLQSTAVLREVAQLEAYRRVQRDQEDHRRPLVLTISPSGAALDRVAPHFRLPSSRGMRLLLHKLEPFCPGRPESGVVIVRFRDEEGDLPTGCGWRALCSVARDFWGHQARVPAEQAFGDSAQGRRLPPELLGRIAAFEGDGRIAVTPVHWSQSQMKEGALFAALLPGLSASEARSWTDHLCNVDLLRDNSIVRDPVPKRCSRLSLFFTADEGRSMGVLRFRVRPDITRDSGWGWTHCYTDGAGLIDADVLRERWKVLLERTLVRGRCPAVVQIRASGCKGTLQAAPGLRDQEGVDVVMTESMRKINFDGEDSAEFFVIGQGASMPLYMSVQALQLLISRGIPEKLFLRRASQHAIGLVRDVCCSKRRAWQLLREDAPFLCEQGPEVEALEPANALCDPRKEPGLRSALLHVLRHRLRGLRDKARFPVAAGRVLVMVPDFTETLRPHEVYIRIQDEKSGPMQVIEGRVAAMKLPALHPADLRIYRAVRNAELEARGMVNAIVYSTDTSALPAAETQGGADYDGDQGWVTWDQELVPPAEGGCSAPVVDDLGNIAAQDYAEEKYTATQLPGTICSAEELFLMVSTDHVLGTVSTLHKIHADIKARGSWSSLALELAALCRRAVDAPKTGQWPRLPSGCGVDDDQRPRYAQPNKRRRHRMEKEPPKTVLERVYEVARHYQGMVDTFLEHQLVLEFAGPAEAEQPRPCAPAQRITAAVNELLPPQLRSAMVSAAAAVAEAAQRQTVLVMRRLWLRREGEFATALLERHGPWARSMHKRNHVAIMLEARAVARGVRHGLCQAAAEYEEQLTAVLGALDLEGRLKPVDVVSCWYHCEMTQLANRQEHAHRRLYSLAWAPLAELERAAAADAYLPGGAAGPGGGGPGGGAAARGWSAAGGGPGGGGGGADAGGGDADGGDDEGGALGELMAPFRAAEEQLLGALCDRDGIYAPALNRLDSKDGKCHLQLDEAERLVRAVANNDVTIVVAPTGRGKSTLVPRLLMEQGCSAPSGAQRVIVSEPRRVACRLLAERVAEDVGCELGGKVGYRVAGENATDEDCTRLAYMTELLVLDALLSGEHFTHFVLDEVHQASLNCDLLLLAARHLLLRARGQVKVVLMSATPDVNRLSDYMARDANGQKCLTVGVEYLGSHQHEVAVHYADALLESEQSWLREDLRAVSETMGLPGWAEGQLAEAGTLWELARRAATELRRVGRRRPQRNGSSVEEGDQKGGEGREEEEEDDGAWLQEPTARGIYARLAADAVCDVHETAEAGKASAIVVFLPGKREAQDVMGWVQWFIDGHKAFLCHGNLSLDGQQEVLSEAARSGRCFVFCTNLLESSVTFPTPEGAPDPVVIDSLLEKRNIDGTLRTELISKSQAEQRKGRTGRRGEGAVYRLATKAGYHALRDHSGSEDSRLAEVLLRVMDREAVGLYSLQDTRKFLGCLPGGLGVDVDSVLESLQRVRALVLVDGSVRRTMVGELLKRQGMDPQSALLVIECCRYGRCGVLGALAASVLRLRRSLYLLPSRPGRLKAALRAQSRIAETMRSDLGPEMAALAAFSQQRGRLPHLADAQPWARRNNLAWDVVTDAAGHYAELKAALHSIGLEHALDEGQEVTLAFMFENHMQAEDEKAKALDTTNVLSSSAIDVFCVSTALAFASSVFGGVGVAERHPNNSRELRVQARQAPRRRRADPLKKTVEDWLGLLRLTAAVRAPPRSLQAFVLFQEVDDMRFAKLACEKLQERVPHRRISQLQHAARWQGRLVAGDEQVLPTESFVFPCAGAVRGAPGGSDLPLFAAAELIRVASAGGGKDTVLASRLTRVPRGLRSAVRQLQGAELLGLDGAPSGHLRRLRELERAEAEALRGATDVGHAARQFRRDHQSSREAAFRAWAHELATAEDSADAADSAAAAAAAAAPPRGKGKGKGKGGRGPGWGPAGGRVDPPDALLEALGRSLLEAGPGRMPG